MTIRMIPRTLSLSRNHSFFLFGPRNSGKSTLLKMHFASINQPTLWIDLLDAQTHYELSQNPRQLPEMWNADKPPWIIIDEVQKSPILLDTVHKMMEEKDIKFALTGSSARKLKRGNANLLGGRAIPFYLLPLCYNEIVDSFDLDRSLCLGMLPRLWASSINEEDMTRFLYAYVDVYLKEEVAAEQLVRKLDPFRRFLAVSAQSNGEIINYSKIERDAGLGAGQAQRHFEILEDTLIGRFLPPYHTSIRKQQVQKSKFYFFDTGVLRALRMMAGESLHSATYEYGNLFETFIVNDIFKMTYALEKRWNFYYLKTKMGVEIDLIIERPKGAPVLIEFKSSTVVKDEYLRSLKGLADKFPGSSRQLWYRGTESIEREGIKCVPWQRGIKELFRY